MTPQIMNRRLIPTPFLLLGHLASEPCRAALPRLPPCKAGTFPVPAGFEPKSEPGFLSVTPIVVAPPPGRKGQVGSYSSMYRRTSLISFASENSESSGRMQVDSRTAFRVLPPATLA